MGKSSVFLTKGWVLFAPVLIIFAGCSSSRYSNVSAGDLHQFIPGLPNFNIGAFGYFNKDQLPGLQIDIGVPYTSLIFKSGTAPGHYEAHFDLEMKITRTDSAGAQPILKSYDRTIDVTRYDDTHSLKNYLIQYRTILVPGKYDVEAMLTDQTSGKAAQRTIQAIIPDLSENKITSTSIELLSKGRGRGDSRNFEPVLTYHVSNSIDSLKADIQLHLNSAKNNLNLRMMLLRFRSDTLPARFPYALNPMRGSLRYRGIDFGKVDTVQATRRNYSGLAGTIAIDFLLPKLQTGIYRVSITGRDKANEVSFTRSRDFAIRNEGFPHLITISQLAEATYYIATPREYKRLMEAYGTDSLRQAFDAFWANLIPNRNKAKSVIESYYSRIEQANMLFSNYKEGWKTDPGMLYVVLGPPAYVEQNVEGMTWYYRQDSYNEPNAFYFQKVINTRDYFPFHHYILMRNIYYQQLYTSRVDDWRNGIVP